MEAARDGAASAGGPAPVVEHTTGENA
jgi:hypothetical protein